MLIIWKGYVNSFYALGSQLSCNQEETVKREKDLVNYIMGKSLN
jgi:hypothetical protein